MIVEGLVTSVDADGRVNLAPMGPVVRGDFEHLTLRPFQPSTTFTNLSTTRFGVFHVVDRVDVIARAAVGQLDVLPEMEPAQTIQGYVLKDCCRWFEFAVDEVDDRETRSVMPSTIRYRGERRSHFGFNRARHAVLEAAILATRVHLISADEIRSALRFLKPAVDKTGDRAEQEAFELLRNFICQATGLSQ